MLLTPVLYRLVQEKAQLFTIPGERNHNCKPKEGY